MTFGLLNEISFIVITLNLVFNVPKETFLIPLKCVASHKSGRHARTTHGRLLECEWESELVRLVDKRPRDQITCDQKCGQISIKQQNEKKQELVNEKPKLEI